MGLKGFFGRIASEIKKAFRKKGPKKDPLKGSKKEGKKALRDLEFEALKLALRKLQAENARLLNGPLSAEIRQVEAPRTSAKAPAIEIVEADSPQIFKNSPNPIASIQDFSLIQLSPHTQRAYRRDLQDFFAFLKLKDLWDTWTLKVGPAQVAEYREYLLHSRGLSKTTVTRKIAVVKSFFKWSLAQGITEKNPAELVKSFPQSQDSKTGFLAEEEINLLLFALSQFRQEKLSAALAKVGVETLLMLGLRRSEACAIRAEHLEYLEGRWLVRVQGKGNRERRLPIPPRLLKTWAAWLARINDEAPRGSFKEFPAAWMDWKKRSGAQPLLISTRGKTFEEALSTSELARIVRKVCRKAGIVNRVSPHVLRATAITHALDQGASHRGVQQMAGWTSPLMITRYDKRRNDPRFSAIHHLKYALEEEDQPLVTAVPKEAEAESPEPPIIFDRNLERLL